jgi:cobalt-zinc-cadmium efflux system protein
MQAHLHSQSPARSLPRQTSSRLALALGLTLALVAVEVIAGSAANSLALLTDAGHNLTDVLTLGLTWFALRLALQPANARQTYGYHRAGILVALFNATTLALIALGIFYEAWQRFLAPPEVRAGILTLVGIVAVLINLLTALLIRGGSRGDLNVRSAFVHLMGDVLSALGAVIAGVIIYFTGLNWLDPLVSVFIGLLILWNAWGILRETIDILLESSPRDVDMSSMLQDVMHVQGVLGVHDLHVWSISSGLRSMSAHIVTDDITLSAGAVIQARISELLSRRYNILHATLQLECAYCTQDGLYCDMDELSGFLR